MAKKTPVKDKERLRQLIEEATVDCYDAEEEYTGLLTMIQDNVVCPFRAKVIGEKVEVIDLDASNDSRGLMAICVYSDKKYPIEITSLEWINPHPKGFEWIEAYLAWRENRGL